MAVIADIMCSTLLDAAHLSFTSVPMSMMVDYQHPSIYYDTTITYSHQPTNNRMSTSIYCCVLVGNGMEGSMHTLLQYAMHCYTRAMQYYY